MEAGLRKSEQDLKDAQHIAKVGSWELHIPNNQLSWSDEIYRIFEIDPAQFAASYDAFLNAIHPEDREAVNQAYTNSLVTRQQYSIRHRLIMADGRIKYVHEQFQTEFDTEGNPLRSMGTVQDVTELVKTEIALQDSRDLLQTVIDHAPLRVFWKDKELRYLGCNPAFANDAGRNQPSELIGQNDYQMGWADRAELYRADDRAIIDSGKARINFEEPQTTPTGQTIWLRTSKVPLRKGNGEIIGVLGIYQDITEEKEKDEELAEYREHLEQLVRERSAQLAEVQLKYQRLLDDMGDEFLAFSFTPDSRVTYVGNGTEAIFGLPKESILGYSWAESIPWLEDDLRETQMAVLELLTGKVDSIRTEMRFMHSDGQIHTIYETSRAIKDVSGNVFAVDGVLTDITQRKRHQTELLEAKLAAEAASRAKSAFLANMSHEIRTPMNGVIGMLEILSRSDLQNDERKMVETIRRSARSLLGIIDDILDFSKIEAGKLNLVEREISLEAELDLVIGMIDRIAMDKQVDLTMFFEPKLPLHVLGDGLRLRQILTNLAGNAVKFSSNMERTGRVQLRAELEGYANGFAMVAFTIADNGIGMNADTVARLFQPFEQADESTTRKYGGTGLGLAISRNLTSMMGGKITVLSEAGQGTTFTVRLPFKVASECPNTASLYDLTGLECILVVKESAYLDDYTRYLAHAGARTHAFADLEPAWTFVTAHRTSSLVCMIVMEDPGILSSREIVDQLLSREPGNHVHFVEVTYLSVERGRRRKVRRLADRVVQIDREALTRQSFLMAAAAATGRVEIPHEPEIDTRIAAPNGAAFRILVAEDNELNRDVIQRQLAMLGYRAELAIDGQEALLKWNTGRFDLLLTDLHMPNTDGYELTRLIRETETRNNLPRMPIIALTANAMKGEEERCLQQGMDAYLSKPIELERLKFALEQWLTSSASSEQTITQAVIASQPVAEVIELPVFDPEVLAKLLGDKPAIHRRLLEKFLKDLPEQTGQLLQACEAGNTEVVQQTAHSLKSVSRSMGAMRLGELCEQLEHAGRAGNSEQCLNLSRQVDVTFDEADTMIRAHLEHL
jgi:PAS domain S-box-containing protein